MAVTRAIGIDKPSDFSRETDFTSEIQPVAHVTRSSRDHYIAFALIYGTQYMVVFWLDILASRAHIGRPELNTICETLPAFRSGNSSKTNSQKSGG